jgi:hypothetical protein
MRYKLHFIVLLLLVLSSIGYSQTTRNVPGSYATIQAAIDAAAPGDIILVAAGTYSESIAVLKNGLILRGAQFGVHANTGARTNPALESIISGVSPVQMVADNITLDGFTIQDATNADKNSGIWTNPSYSGTLGGFTIINNIVQNNPIGLGLVGTTNPNLVQYNLFKNNNNPGPGSGTGIYVFNPLSNAIIDNNKFEGNLNAAIIFGDTQSGLTISNNVADNQIALGTTTASSITGNTITGSPGNGINLFGDNSGIIITGNTVTNGVVGIIIKNTGNANITIHSNTLTGNSTAGLQVNAGSYTGTVDAINNWWGTANGPANTANTFNVGSQGNAVADLSPVQFVPWLNAAPPGGISFAPLTNNDIPTEYYSNFADAIAGTDAGHTITAAAGTFTGDVAVNKSLILTGTATCTISKFILTANSVTISGFNVPIINVSGSGKIQDAVNGVNATGTVNVAAGNYSSESVTVNKILTLTGTPVCTVNKFTLGANPVTITGFNVLTIDIAPGGNIQNAVNGVSAGGTINVPAGAYAQSITIDKNVTIIGTGNPTITSFTLTNGAQLGGTSGGITAPVVFINQTGAVGAKLNDAVLLCSPGGTINVSGTTAPYAALTINKPVTILAVPGVIINHGSPAMTVSSTGVVITGFAFNFNSSDFAIDVLAGAYNVTISNCDFLNTNGVNVGNGVRNQGTGNVIAINNFWGDPDGPTVGSNTCGLGCVVSNTSTGTLTYSPWYIDLTHTTIMAAPTLTSPTNLAVGVTVVPNFQWSFPIVGAPTYTIEIATDNAFTNIVFGPTAPSPATSTNFQLPPANALVNGVTYYWRIKATIGAATACNFKQFISIAPSVPYLTNPYNGNILSGTTTTFAWYSGTVGIQYTLQIAQDLGFTVPITGQPGVDITTTTNTYYVLNNSILTTGGTYYWRVIAKTIAVTPVIIDYSSTWQFSMPGLPQPYASYPIGGVTIYNNPPTLYWYTGVYNPLVTQYIVRYRRSDHVSYQTYPYSPNDNYGTFATLSTNYFVTIPAALDAGYQYFWEVASYDGTNFSAWSTESSFTVYSNITLVVCYPSFPTGGGTIYFNPPTLYWYTNVYAPGLQFRVQYANNVSFTGPTTATGILTNSYTIPNALAMGHWYWRVAASFDGVTWGAYSAPGDFDVPAGSSSSAAIVPTPYNPTSGSIVYVVNPTLSWVAYSTAALQFQVIVATDPTMGSGVLSNPILTSPWTSSSSYVLTGLTPGAVYYWQVRSRLVSNNLIISAWSTLAWFVESPGAAAVVPIAGSPVGGTAINNNSAVLSWVLPAQSNSALTYTVQYGKKQDFSDASTVANVKSTNVTVSNLDKGTTYYWRASSQTNTGSTSNYSGSGSFNTNSVTGVTIEPVVPTNYELQQNYPNPFNPSTKISFSLTQSSIVTINIYDMLGRVVKTLVNNEMPAGVHTFEWRGDNNSGGLVASGPYIYRINAGEFTATKKMVFLK